MREHERMGKVGMEHADTDSRKGTFFNDRIQKLSKGEVLLYLN